MATIKFFIQTKKNPAGIYVRLKEGTKIDAKAKTKFLINPEQWNNGKWTSKQLKDSNIKNLNGNLSKLFSNVLEQYNNSIESEEINSSWLKNIVNPSDLKQNVELDEEKIPDKLIEHFDYYAKHKKSEISNGTLKKYLLISI